MGQFQLQITGESGSIFGANQHHETDRVAIEHSINTLIDSDSTEFDELVKKIYLAAKKIFPKNTDEITTYVVENASRATLTVINSERDRIAAGENATEPSSPFSIIIGGNIISRGVTFPNLLSMFFTRNVRHRLQQDTYIQRARMFGARGEYLEHFELTIPSQLYSDWHRCFVFHKLALATVEEIGSPVWIGDKRISIAVSASIEKATVAIDRGEMSFGMFEFSNDLDTLVLKDQQSIKVLRKLQKIIGIKSLPRFLINSIETVSSYDAGTLAIHTAASIDGYNSADKVNISRSKGFIGNNQLEKSKFPDAVHHIKILHNSDGKAKLFYKYKGSLQFTRNKSQASSMSTIT
ncbi:Z1 domain-containing protein [Duganella sp. CF517]|uniref:Z1 domain-containing protein n=1 Tax=Duganella sp. CF517 TaxID=1881038 RepID=UPI000B7FAB4C|nr:Z1 domain-containing protein [Duganella sp. CF517]